MKRFSRHLLQLFWGAVLLHLVWILGYLLISSPVLPAPWQVYEHLTHLDGTELLGHTLASFRRIAWGVLVATGLASSVALLMYLFPKVGRVVSTFIYFSYPIPKLALLPIVMLLAGLGEATKVVMIVLIILFQLIVSIRDALRGISSEHHALLRSLGADEGLSYDTCSCQRPCQLCSPLYALHSAQLSRCSSSQRPTARHEGSVTISPMHGCVWTTSGCMLGSPC